MWSSSTARAPQHAAKQPRWGVDQGTPGTRHSTATTTAAAPQPALVVGDGDLVLLAGGAVLGRHIHDACSRWGVTRAERTHDEDGCWDCLCTTNSSKGDASEPASKPGRTPPTHPPSPTVGVDVKGDADLRDAARRGRDAGELKLAEQVVVAGLGALALVHLDEHRRLVVRVGREDLPAGGGGQGGADRSGTGGSRQRGFVGGSRWQTAEVCLDPATCATSIHPAPATRISHQPTNRPTCSFLVGTVVLRGMSAVITPPTVSRPRLQSRGGRGGEGGGGQWRGAVPAGGREGEEFLPNHRHTHALLSPHLPSLGPLQPHAPGA